MKATFLLPLLVGCFNPYDGTYQYEAEFQGSVCTDQDGNTSSSDYQTNAQGMASIYTTSQGNLVANVGVPLRGARSGKAFELTNEYGWQDSSCDNYRYELTTTFEGEFTADQGFEGELVTNENYIRAGCGDSSDDETEACKSEWELIGVRLNSSPSRRPTKTVNWGYTPASAY